MKVLSVEQIRRADQYTIEKEPISDINLMERAACEIVAWLLKNIKEDDKLHFFVGKGNNGGDAYAVARLLKERGYHIMVYSVGEQKGLSGSCHINYLRYLSIGKIYSILSLEDFPSFVVEDIIVDGIFGSGLSRPVTGFIAELIHKINQQENRVIAIDSPSGLFIDKSNITTKGAIVKASQTLSLQFPKKAFLFPETAMYVGTFIVLDIGLHPEYIKAVDCKDFFIDKLEVAGRIKERTKFSHKGTFGHALLMAGSYGKYGAAILAAKAAIRSGAGLITAHLPVGAMIPMQVAAPEIMISFDENEQILTSLPDLGQYNSIAIGPGIGKAIWTKELIEELFRKSKIPLILDADALNILSESKYLLDKIPFNTILTPHPKEFQRLFGRTRDDFERYELLKEKAKKHKCIIVLKGAHTSIAMPNGYVFFNSTGNPGMATAGSGDVLTGILLGLLASGYASEDAAIIGVYLHGLAADIALQKNSYESLIASDITVYLGEAFKKVKPYTTF